MLGVLRTLTSPIWKSRTSVVKFTSPAMTTASASGGMKPSPPCPPDLDLRGPVLCLRQRAVECPLHVEEDEAVGVRRGVPEEIIVRARRLLRTRPGRAQEQRRSRTSASEHLGVVRKENGYSRCPRRGGGSQEGGRHRLHGGVRLPPCHTQVWQSDNRPFLSGFWGAEGSECQSRPAKVAFWVWSECDAVIQGRSDLAARTGD